MIEPIFLDFETYSELDVRQVGSCRYAEHPSTDVICLAYAIGDDDPTVWIPGTGFPRELFDHIADGAELHAWNTEFELAIWEQVCAGKRLWPAVPFDQWRDTAALAMTYALPAKLETCAEVLELGIQKDPRGHHLVNKLSKPRKPSKNNPATRWTPRNALQDFLDFYAYCSQDVRVERAIHHALPTSELTEEELDLWRMTVRMNSRGWKVDSASVAQVIDLIGEHLVRANNETEKITDGKVRSGKQVAKLRAWLLEKGVRMDDLKADTVDLVLKGDDHLSRSGGHRMPSECRRVLEIRREVAKASVSKFKAIERRTCHDGRVKNLLAHHGAKTGRDAGRGIQIQNFPRRVVSDTEEGVEVALRALRVENSYRAVEILHGSVPHFASALLRPMLMSAPGKLLFAADLSQIENRIASWYAGCRYGIELYEDGLDEYILFASELYGVSYEDVTSDQRFHCKHAVLGCQFGMGDKGLQNQSARFGHPIELSFAKDLVDGYRDLYSEVKDFWYALERAAKLTVRTGKQSVCGRVTFEMDGDFLMMCLAPDREIAYHRPALEMKETPWGELRETIVHGGYLGQSKKWGRVKLIPGRIFENLVQATARDVMMHGAHLTEAAGYDLVGRIHDELISEKEEGSVEEYVELMKAPPPWLRGIPISAEGWSGRRYRKG